MQVYTYVCMAFMIISVVLVCTLHASTYIYVCMICCIICMICMYSFDIHTFSVFVCVRFVCMVCMFVRIYVYVHVYNNLCETRTCTH